MKYKKLTENESYKLLCESYNTPTSSISEQDYRREWFSARDNLRKYLDFFGVHDYYEQGDYCLSDVSNPSRILPVAFTSEKFVSPLMIQKLVDFVKDMDISYRIDVSIFDDYEYGVFISKEGVSAWCSKELESILGLEPKK